MSNCKATILPKAAIVFDTKGSRETVEVRPYLDKVDY